MCQIGDDIFRRVVQDLELDPTPGAIVDGQRFPLENDNDYFIKLYFERKLIGLFGNREWRNKAS